MCFDRFSRITVYCYRGLAYRCCEFVIPTPSTPVVETGLESQRYRSYPLSALHSWNSNERWTVAVRARSKSYQVHGLSCQSRLTARWQCITLDHISTSVPTCLVSLMKWQLNSNRRAAVVSMSSVTSSSVTVSSNALSVLCMCRRFCNIATSFKRSTVKLLVNAPGVYSNNRQIPPALVESWRARVVVVRVE